MKTKAPLLVAALLCTCLLAGCQASNATPAQDTLPDPDETATVEPEPNDRGGSPATDAFDGTEPPTETALAVPEAYGEMHARVASLVEAYPLDAGVAFVDLSVPAGRAGFQVNGDERLVAASMIKLVILAEFLDEVDQGLLSMEEAYTIQAADIVGGTGSVQSRGAGATYTLAELAQLMISESDNVAANVLVERMGMDAVNAQAEKLGLEQTQLNRLMMDETAIANRIENYMSAEDVSRVLALIWRGDLVSAEASAFALQALEAQGDSSGILAGLPPDIAFAHKTGTLTQVKNDGGIVEAERPYVLVTMCSGGDISTALSLMEEVSSAVYDASQSI